MIYAGFDCGGSNTRCMLVSQDGNILGVGKGGAANYTFCGMETAANSMRESISQAFHNAGLTPQPLDGAFVASAPAEVFGDAKADAFYREVSGCKNAIIRGDIFPIWYAGSQLAPAVAMIAGTGTSVYLLKDNTYSQTSGWGPILGDEGSGYDIGNRAIRYAARMADGRMIMDESFYHSILSHFNIDPKKPGDLVDAATGSTYVKQVASASRVVMNLYEAGNPLAKELISYAAEELTLAVSTLLHKVPNQEFALLLSGGLLENDTPLRRVFLRSIQNNPQISSVQVPYIQPVQAAASLALLYSGHAEAAELLLHK